MNLKVVRYHFTPSFTVGGLYLGQRFICYTIEDTVREVIGQPVEAWKVAGETAIPKGTYALRLTLSQRFQKVLPQLMDVPGFSGVRIHTGNTSHDTEGCLIVGSSWDGKSDFIGGSRTAMATLMPMLESASEPVTLTIE